MPKRLTHPKKRSSRRRSNNGAKAAGPASVADMLIKIGRSIPLSEWDKIPPDYFANLDAYRSGKLKPK